MSEKQDHRLASHQVDGLERYLHRPFDIPAQVEEAEGLPEPFDIRAGSALPGA